MQPSGTQPAVPPLLPTNSMGPGVFTAFNEFTGRNNSNESCPPMCTFNPTSRPLPRQPEQHLGEQATLPQPCQQPRADDMPPMSANHLPHPRVSSYDQQVSRNKQKNSRASRACDLCRSLKIKCDQGRPCNNCMKKGVDCIYQITPKISDIAHPLSCIEKKFDQRFDRLERLLISLGTSDERWNATISSAKSESSEQAACIEPLALGHTARTSLLLNWPSIQTLTADLLKAEGILSIDEFPISIEQELGIFRIFGHDGAQNPEFDRYKVELYTQSFKNHILNMHPIILPNELNLMVEAFLNSLSTARTIQGGIHGSAKPVHQSISFPPLRGGRKRKFLDVADHRGHSAASKKPGLSRESINDAVVLLVLALGKICLRSHTSPDAIPGLDYFAIATQIISSQWDDEDFPAGDILAARLRAKYWDSQVILYRPFLDNILHRGQVQTTIGWASPNSGNTPDHARLAIQALVESTRAFYGLGEDQPLIITNIFETAHS
ncbi:hypothetical protein NUW58_g6133 [Xylaria curta]|uniref:Uncharacterized protein n=1 Tax=Xylaria curta TaxID=42375 RepID=A0ACC1NZ15_9PEZI|nr:hypothetical protein NUW58_g6133 [Xylaria curta]